MNVLKDLLLELKVICAGLIDKRRSEDCKYGMDDIGLAAFSVFFLHAKSVVSGSSAVIAHLPLAGRVLSDTMG